MGPLDRTGVSLRICPRVGAVMICELLRAGMAKRRAWATALGFVEERRRSSSTSARFVLPWYSIGDRLAL